MQPGSAAASVVFGISRAINAAHMVGALCFPLLQCTKTGKPATRKSLALPRHFTSLSWNWTLKRIPSTDKNKRWAGGELPDLHPLQLWKTSSTDYVHGAHKNETEAAADPGCFWQELNHCRYVINWSEWYFSDLCTCPPKVLMLGVLFNHFCTSHPCPHRQGTDRDCAERTRGCRTEAQCPPCTSLPFSHARDASKANVPPGGTQQGKQQKTSKNFQTSKKNFQTSKNFQSQAKETQLLGSWWSRSAGFWRRATWHTRLHRPRRTH